MNRELLRLRTFQNWPANAPVSFQRIAKAGFYYTGRGQEVQCFLCGVIVAEWGYDDQPFAIHRAANPDCPFVRDPNGTCNLPLLTSPESESLMENTGQILASGRHEQHRADNNNTYLNYVQRLQTFVNWPIAGIVAPERLAQSGFYYLQQQDAVECTFCRGVLLNWKPGDDPDHLHRLQFPYCTFYSHQDGNPDQSTTEKVINLDNVKLMPGTTSNLVELGVQEHSAPKQGKYATFDARLSTFQGWPTHLKQSPEMLAGAGFYYVGVEDQVRCFHCDGGLRNWEETDDVWIEHAKWFPKCKYVSLVQGPEFVKQCIQTRANLKTSAFPGIPEDNPDLSRSPSSSSGATSVASVRTLSDSELQNLLSSPPAMAALELGLHVGRVKMALKRRMEHIGLPYVNADQLIEDATHIQLEEEDNITNSANTPGSPSTELTYLLNQIITSDATSSNSSSDEVTRETQNVQNDPDTEQPNEMPSKKSQDTAVCSKTEKTVSLEEENRRLKEARLCKICMDREVAVVFLPCGHLSTCIFCAPSLKYCPMCRQEIRATVRTFLA